MGHPQKFRQADVTRAIKAAREAGCDVKRCEIDHEGKIVLIFAGPALATEPEKLSPLEKWKQAHPEYV